MYFGCMTSKIEFEKIDVMNMSYIMDSDRNSQFTTFPNFFSLISADPTDLSNIEKKIIFMKKSHFFDRKPALKGTELIQQHKHYSPKSA